MICQELAPDIDPLHGVPDPLAEDIGGDVIDGDQGLVELERREQHAGHFVGGNAMIAAPLAHIVLN